MNENIQQTQINRILEMLEGYEHRFDEIDNRFEIVDNRFDAIEKSFEKRFDMLSEQVQHRERISRLEATKKQHDKQFATMITELGRRIDKIDKMRNRIIGLFLGIMLPMCASILITILLKK